MENHHVGDRGPVFDEIEPLSVQSCCLFPCFLGFPQLTLPSLQCKQMIVALTTMSPLPIRGVPVGSKTDMNLKIVERR